MRNGNLAGLLAEQASEAGWYDRPAFYAADVVTHGQIHDGAARLGEVLRNRGLSSGDRVLLCLPDSPDLVQLLLACLARGVMAFLANPELHRDDHALAARNTEPALVVTSDALRDRFQPSRVAEAANSCPRRLESRLEATNRWVVTHSHTLRIRLVPRVRRRRRFIGTPTR